LAEAVTAVEARYPTLTHCPVTADLSSALLFDVRSAKEHGVSHLPGAVHWQGVDQALRVIAQRAPMRVVLYCSVGERSSAAAEELAAVGCAVPLANLRGGIFAWSVANLPLVDAAGQTVAQVHPYNDRWGRLLPESKRAAMK
jgi:rhodanese-related sulfurtransferase